MPSFDLLLIENEVKKIVKNYSINFIVHENLSENVSVLSEILVNLVEERNEIFHVKVINTLSEDASHNVKCIYARAVLKVAKVELNSQKRNGTFKR